ncbi:hypothetical protein DFA_00058 [Cavenderia fasciculata]|uniref:Queuosine 5'-phosphate N-glycosylase/hydrolase n=1 Tax=Cavenderia fasciculata TaxID=261658 RepID=F4PXH1_CACFS|nr:uncharacterized protein DFA_00058 [Cavenderia fasciculata]EGG19481.1 hypothetical protein DFA_00058 [Cavenderia fasciculata]|eukprot:XP_004357775.1 hypothetical protein DFA_00058 [Cavenderia fasciculata]
MGNNQQQQQQDDIFNKVIESNKWLSENSKYVKINNEEIDNFIKTLSKEQYNKHSSLVTFPLNFSSIQQEVCFWFILDLINIGSGFRKELHEVSDRGAYETICYGLLVSTEVQQPDLPGIYTYRDSVVKPLIVNIHKILKESAEIIYRLGHSDFGAYVLSLYNVYDAEQGPLASTLVQALVDTFPAFKDEAKYTDGETTKTIYLEKKAQLLAADLYRRFKDTDARFNFIDVDRMSIFTDNVVPAVLRKLNILQVTDDTLVQQINQGRELPAQSPQEVELRGLAIYASRLIVQRAAQIFSSTPEENFIGNDVKLDYYLWSVGKQPEYRSFERHSTKQTLFY